MPTKIASVNELNAITTLTVQVTALFNKFDALGVHAIQSPIVSYELYKRRHAGERCPISLESVQFVTNYNRQQIIHTRIFTIRVGRIILYFLGTTIKVYHLL